MPKALKGPASLATMADAVRLASDREAMVMAALAPEARPPRAGYAAALASAAKLMEELTRSAAEGARRTRSLRGRAGLWLGSLASHLMR
jgi:hypothetical protein